MPLRITIDAGCLSHPGRTGIGRCLESVLPRLINAAGDRAEFILLAGKPLCSDVALELIGRGALTAKTANFPSLYAWQQSGMALALRAVRPDVHYACDGLAPPFSPAPVVVLIHDLLWKRHPETLSRHVRLAYALRARASLTRAAVALAGSQFTKDEALRVFGDAARKIELARCHGVDCALFRPATAQERAGVDPVLVKRGLIPGYVVCLGNLMAHKNLGLVPAALEWLRDRGETPPVLALAGLGEAGGLFPPGYPPDLARPLGYLPDEEARIILRNALCLVYPSRYEGFGLPLLEAMASGVPVIHCGGTALPEAAGDAGLTVSADDPSGLARAISRLRSDEAERDRLIGLGLTRAAAFSWDDCARDLWSALVRAAETGKKS